MRFACAKFQKRMFHRCLLNARVASNSEKKNMIHAENAIAILLRDRTNTMPACAITLDHCGGFRNGFCNPSTFGYRDIFLNEIASRFRICLAPRSECHCREFANIAKDRGSIFDADSTNETESLAIAKWRREKRKTNAWDGDEHLKPVPRFQLFMHLARKESIEISVNMRCACVRIAIRSLDIKLLPAILILEMIKMIQVSKIHIFER